MPEGLAAGEADKPEPSETTKAAREFSEELVDATRQFARTRLSILYDKDAELFITRSIDKSSGEVVRQYPYEQQIERIRFFLEQRREADENRIDRLV